MNKIVTVEFMDYESSINSVLSQLNASEILASQSEVLIKPNLVNSSFHPVTTPVEICSAIVSWLKEYTSARIVIAEGTGDLVSDTISVFERLGYGELSREKKVQLIDLNNSKTCLLKNDSNSIIKEFHMPEIAMESFIISVPVLKAHSLSIITGTMKNMLGFAPPKYYQAGGHWKKSFFHDRIHQKIVDLNRFRHADLTIMDATIGLPEYHLGGRICDPPVNKILTGLNPVLTDRKAAELLGIDWQIVPHLSKLL